MAVSTQNTERQPGDKFMSPDTFVYSEWREENDRAAAAAKALKSQDSSTDVPERGARSDPMFKSTM